MAGPSKLNDEEFNEILDKKNILKGMVNRFAGDKNWQTNPEDSVILKISPFYHLRLDIPVLLIHGTVDYTVAYSQSEIIYKALQEKGNAKYEFLTRPEKDHDLLSKENRAISIQAMLDFLSVVGQQ